MDLTLYIKSITDSDCIRLTSGANIVRAAADK